MPTILVIDDLPPMRRLIRRILEKQGYNVVLAENGIAGIAQYFEKHPDLVITDMIMPKQGGAETITAIRQEAPNAKIIAITGGGNINSMHPLTAALKLGATEMLQKPFLANELLTCVTRALSSYVEEN